MFVVMQEVLDYPLATESQRRRYLVTCSFAFTFVHWFSLVYISLLISADLAGMIICIKISFLLVFKVPSKKFKDTEVEILKFLSCKI